MKLKQLLNQQEVFDIYDILVDDTIDPHSDYLTIYVAHNANGIKISIETYENQPCMNPTAMGISLAAE